MCATWASLTQSRSAAVRTLFRASSLRPATRWDSSPTSAFTRYRCETCWSLPWPPMHQEAAARGAPTAGDVRPQQRLVASASRRRSAEADHNATASENLHAWPATVNNGKTILFTSVPSSGVQRVYVEAVEIDTGKRHVPAKAQGSRATSSGHLVFYRDGGLHAAPFDAGRLTVTGPAIEVTAAVEQDSSGAPLAEISRAGSLVYRRAGAASGRLMWVTRQGIEQSVTDVPRAYLSPRLSADTHRIVIGVGSELWIQDTLRSTFTRLTPQQSETASYPVWTPDGKQIVFRTPTGLRLIETDGSGRSEPIAGTTSVISRARSRRTVEQWRRHDARRRVSSTFTCYRSPAILRRMRSSRVQPSRGARSFPQTAAGWRTCRMSPVGLRCTCGAIQVPKAAGPCQLAAEPLHSGVTLAMSSSIAAGTR